MRSEFATSEYIVVAGVWSIGVALAAFVLTVKAKAFRRRLSIGRAPFDGARDHQSVGGGGLSYSAPGLVWEHECGPGLVSADVVYGQ